MAQSNITEKRDGCERRDERTERFLGDADRRHGPRRFCDREHDDGTKFGDGRYNARSVAARNPDLHPLFAGILQRHGA